MEIKRRFDREVWRQSQEWFEQQPASSRGIKGEVSMNDQAIEQEIQDKGLTAPRVTPADIEANIDSAFYFTASDAIFGEVEHLAGSLQNLKLLTFCVVVLKNGFTVTGESACASPENFNAEIGRKIARENAVQKIWPLMGYALKQTLDESAKIGGYAQPIYPG